MSKRAKAAWRCRRGMRELDVLLERFMERRYDALSDADKAAFEQLLEHSNDDLLAWLISGSPCGDDWVGRIVREILAA